MYNNHKQRESSDTVTRIIDSMFFHEKEIAAAIRQAHADVMNGTRTSGGGTGHGDPTAVKGISLASEIKTVRLTDGRTVKYPERWLKVVKETYKHLDGIQRSVCEEKYRKHKHFRRSLEALEIDQNTYYGAVKEARQIARLCAVQLGLIKIIK